jgi:hypothetical protein
LTFYSNNKTTTTTQTGKEGTFVAGQKSGYWTFYNSKGLKENKVIIQTELLQTIGKPFIKIVA